MVSLLALDEVEVEKRLESSAIAHGSNETQLTEYLVTEVVELKMQLVSDRLH